MGKFARYEKIKEKRMPDISDLKKFSVMIEQIRDMKNIQNIQNSVEEIIKLKVTNIFENEDKLNKINLELIKTKRKIDRLRKNKKIDDKMISLIIQNAGKRVKEDIETNYLKIKNLFYSTLLTSAVLSAYGDITYSLIFTTLGTGIFGLIRYFKDKITKIDEMDKIWLAEIEIEEYLK